jgi:pimeloyl-ACP methyl ester carboxylesterase
MRKLSRYFVSIALVAGCGDDAPTKTPDANVVTPDAPVETLGAPPELAMPCTDSLADVYNLPSSLPTMDDTHRGDVFRCAPSESLSTYKVNAQIDAYNNGYTLAAAGKATSGFWTFRIAYRSQRWAAGTDTPPEGDTAAILLVPEKPLANAPLIVFGHGSAGFAPKCAPSHLNLAGAVEDQDYPPALYRLAGAGYTVIAPDYNGFAYGQAPGYFNAQDEAHAVLDATRAAAKILKSPPAKVAFVGHSQGGHAVISAQAYAEAYGMTGELVGVATLAPFWTSMSTFAAGTQNFIGLSTSTDVSTILYMMAYAYSAGELRYGAGHGVDVFATGKQAAAKEVIVGAECYDKPKMMALGAKPSDFFDASYVMLVGGQCALNGTCTDQLSMDWKSNWISDRPTIDTTGTPMLVITSPADTFVTPQRAACAKLAFDTALMATGATTTVDYCQAANTSTGHRDLVRTTDVDYVMSWVAAKAGIGAAPPACTAPAAGDCGSLPQDF